MDSFSAIRLTKQADFIYRFCVCIWPIGHREMSHCYTFEWNTLTKHSLYVRFNSSRNCSIFHKMTKQTTNTGNSTLSTQMPHDESYFLNLCTDFFSFFLLFMHQKHLILSCQNNRDMREKEEKQPSQIWCWCVKWQVYAQMENAQPNEIDRFARAPVFPQSPKSNAFDFFLCANNVA